MIKSWLIDTVRLSTDIAYEYAYLFVENGFDDISVISDITENN